MGRVDWPRRILTVLVGIPAALWLLRSSVGMCGLATSLCVLCVFEFAANIAPRIVAPRAAAADIDVDVDGKSANSGAKRRVVLAPASPWQVVSLSLVVCAAACTGHKSLHDAALLLVTVASCCLHLAAATRVDMSVLSALLLDVFALVYVVSGFGHAILLRSATRFGLGFQILGLSCAWVCDTGALVAGNLLGHKKLAPAVSPGKTVVGAVVGVASAVATVLCLFQLPHWTVTGGLDGFLPVDGIAVGEQVALGLVIGVLCIVGDLVESLLKRVADVKDSGAFFPGHGGCLDRMDSFLFVAPALFYYSHLRLSTVPP